MTKSNHWLYPNREIDSVWTDAPDGRAAGVCLFRSRHSKTRLMIPVRSRNTPAKSWCGPIGQPSRRWAGVPPKSNAAMNTKSFKKQVAENLLDQFAKYFPRLAELIVFHELSTPLATASITGHRRGSFYGLDVTPHRVMTDALRMKTPIDGLYLTGQDVLSPGIPGAFWGGFLCAGSIDPKVFMSMRAS